MHADSPFLVKPSVPILYFGDALAYEQSPIKIISVGLNPSHAEFPQVTPFERFAIAEILTSSYNSETHLQALNQYFVRRPYTKWFNGSFQKVLEGMNGSYYEGAINTALHTDICSVLATSPTWSKLTPDQKGSLEHQGARLWHALVECLEPDVILVSVAAKHLKKIKYPLRQDWCTVYRTGKNGDYEFKRSIIQIKNKKSCVYWGKAAQMPFAQLSYPERIALGAFIEEDCKYAVR